MALRDNLGRLKARVLRGSRRALYAAALTGAVLGGGCSLKADSVKGVDAEVSQEQVRAALRKLFPDLTEEEITRYSAKLDLSAVLDLKVEIEALRLIADSLSKELDDATKDAYASRSDNLAQQNDGFPAGVEPVGRAAFYDATAKTAQVALSGVFNDHTAVTLDSSQVSVSIDGVLQDTTLQCAPDAPVDIVLLVDITGSMRSVIKSVRSSLLAFSHALAERQVNGTLSVVTFQDSVGVNVGFQESRSSSGYERSPFASPVAIDDEDGMAELERFIARLEADSGADRPENLAGAIDFARSDVIGLTSDGKPNVIGDGIEDPKGVSAWPGFKNQRQIFVAITDAPFHGDSRTPKNSSLLAAFKPRAAATILQTLQASGTVVHVSDPSWVDETPTAGPSEPFVDADYWAINTGGLGQDRVAGYSLVDLDLIVHSQETGLLDILLDGIVSSSCTITLPKVTLSADAKLSLDIDVDGNQFSETMSVVRY